MLDIWQYYTHFIYNCKHTFLAKTHIVHNAIYTFSSTTITYSNDSYLFHNNKHCFCNCRHASSLKTTYFLYYHGLFIKNTSPTASALTWSDTSFKLVSPLPFGLRIPLELIRRSNFPPCVCFTCSVAAIMASSLVTSKGMMSTWLGCCDCWLCRRVIVY